MNLLISMKLKWLAEIIASATVSAADKRLTCVRWDGADWKFTWRHGSYYASSAFARPKSITESEQLFLTKYIPSQGDIILDVGAGGGTQVCTFSAMVGPAGKVISIEADPAAVRRLKKQVADLQYNNVHILEIAVGDTEEIVNLSVLEGGHVGNSIVATVGASEVAIRCRPLRDVLAEFAIPEIAFMKMNIEGAEYKALQGLGSAIRDIKEMCISCHDFTGIPDQRTYQSVYELLVAQKFFVSTLPANPQAPWETYYLLASRDTDSDSEPRNEAVE